MHEGRMAGRTGRAVARPVRVARSHVPRVLLAAVALIVVLLQVSTAYALPDIPLPPGFEWNDGYPLGEILMNETLGERRATCVYGANSNFMATLCLIGRKSDYLQLSPEQLSELSGEGTGGAFYELSLRWNNFALDGGPTVAENGYSAGFVAAVDGLSLFIDPHYIWYGDYTYYGDDSLLQRALNDYMTIYNGGHLGGPSDDVAQSFSLHGSTDFYSSPKSSAMDYSGNFSGARDYRTFVWDFSITNNVYNVIKSKLAEYPYVFAFTRWNVGYFEAGRNTDFQLFMCKDQPTLSFRADGYHVDITGGSSIVFDSGRLTINNTASAVFSNASFSKRTTIGESPTRCWYMPLNFDDSGGGGGGGGTWPEPDPPSPPKPPDVPGPDPYGPDIEPPDPYMPIIDPPTNPDPVTDPYVVVVAPDSTDIIEWLRAILRAINNLGDKLNDESTELQNALNKVFFTNLSNLLKNLKGQFIQDYTSWLDKELEWFNGELHDYFVDLQNYLYKLFDWLADQMNFEVNLETDPYDDTSLLNWLRRIYNKLGAGSGPNTRPVDPSTDEDGFLDWLRRMIQNFILDLGAAASDVVSDLGDLLSRLFAKFPFSVPWDLLAILGILDAPTMVPRLTFDIPLTFGTSTITWHVDIDLQAWSVYMEAVRTIILVSFISWLIWLTPQVLRDLDPGDFL